MAVLSVTLHGGAVGDTKSLPKTLKETQSNLGKLIKRSKAGDTLHKDAGRELVADKGYHGNATLESLTEVGYRTYISEPDRGGRKWKGKKEALGKGTPREYASTVGAIVGPLFRLFERSWLYFAARTTRLVNKRSQPTLLSIRE